MVKHIKNRKVPQSIELKVFFFFYLNMGGKNLMIGISL
jgi:hypothetical protein